MKLHKLSNGAYIDLSKIEAALSTDKLTGVPFGVAIYSKHWIMGLETGTKEEAISLVDEIASIINEAAEQEKRDWPLMRGEEAK